MPILYVETGSQSCERVLLAADEIDIDLELRNIADPGIAEELLLHGGMRLVPYLVDEEQGIALYESDDIIRCLHERFS